ncbi:MAG: 50S ribosomal protein L4 [Hyphomicrobiales bacterium]|nr:MAG: 50S ribosomal protein L4 [Hyphomicrobiales bacterium]
MKLDVKTLDGGKAGSIELADDIFGLEPRTDIIHRVVRWQLAKRRAGTHKSKTRNEISRTGKKFGRQKGGGGARHGDRKSPIFIGGGKSFGPVVRSHEHDLPKKIRALGLKLALSAKAKGDAIIVLDEVKAGEAKTKDLREKLGKIGLGNALIIDGSEIDTNFRLAARNIPDLDVLPIEGANVYDIMRRQTLVLTKAAVAALEERFK